MKVEIHEHYMKYIKVNIEYKLYHISTHFNPKFNKYIALTFVCHFKN
jgi:hypothetical protein